MFIDDADAWQQAARRRAEKQTGNPYPVHLTSTGYDKRRGGTPQGWELIDAICIAEWQQECADRQARADLAWQESIPF